MKKVLFLLSFIGVVLMLVACGHESSGISSQGERAHQDYELVDGGESNDEQETGEPEPLGTGDRECLAVRVEGSVSMGMDEFFEIHREIINEYLEGLDAFFNARIDNYTGLFYIGSGEYVILLAEDIVNWQIPDLLEDVNFTVCRAEHSYTELSEVRTQIDNNYTYTSARITGWGIGTLENRVLVYVADLTDEVILDFKENVSDSPLIEFIDSPSAIFYATILEMHDEPQAGWYGDQMTVLVTSEEQGRMVFDHRRLENIGATVGDVVELTITGDWPQPDPAPVYPDSWRLVD